MTARPVAEAEGRAAPCVVAIGAAGGATGYAYAVALAQQHPTVRGVSVDTRPREAVSAAVFCAAHRVVEPFRDDALAVARLAALVAAERVTHYLPLLSDEVAWARRAREAVARRMPRLKILGAAGDAAPWATWATDADACRTHLEALHLRVAGADAVARAAPSAWLHVDVLPRRGAGVVVDDAFVVVRRSLARRGDVCMHVRIEPHARAEALARRLVGGWGIESAFCFEALEGDDGELAVVRVHPRLGAGSAFGAANGCDFFAAHWAQAFGHDADVHLRPTRPRVDVTRQFVEFVA